MSGYKKFGYDLLPVTAGVLLALFISNTQQSWKQKKFTDQVMQTIVEENKANIAQIDSLLQKQYRTLDTLAYYTDSTNITIVDVIRKVNGLSTPDIINNGADFLLKGNQTVIDVDLLMKLAKINEAIENYDMALNQVTSGLYNDVYSAEPNDKRKLQLLLSDIMNYERTIKVLSEDFNEGFKDKN
tara:strand:+ start:264 stop:818 length:555 start_codon:yes stop_codon:yes gene_type:complete